MCDHESFENLEERVDTLENRLTKVETEVAAMREECRQGFADIKVTLYNVYEERRAWSAWARENLPPAAKTIGKWLIGLILIAVGVNNIPHIIKVFAGSLAQ